ncbi:MAG: sigma 54-interacting transcriptional regulator, partial [Desulfobulbaceae bacterium]|nr:sigma 54-interacting transcriptional regulator [Desulfobulbaceae bacterium]
MPRQLRKDFAAKLGDYLLEEDIHATDSLHNALKKQTELKKNGVFKPLGVIFREENGPSPQLERALQRMHHDVLAASPLFQDLPDESLTNTLLNAEQRIVAKNTILFHKGEKLDSFFFIISGKVKAYLLDDEGHEVTMATLQSGEGFGESILCDEEYSGVSMKTLEPTSLFLFSKQYFNRLKDVYPQLSIALLKCLTNKLRLGYENLAGASENEHDLLGFISRRDTPCLPDLLGQTPRINKLRKSILKAAVHSHPLLITGEPGTEKSALALMLHNHGPNQNGTFLSMNAEEVFLEGYGGAILDSTEIFRLEMAQCSELFGRCPGTMPTAKSKRLGLLSIATNGTVFIEHIEKLTLGTGKALFSYLTTNQFIQMGGTKSIDSQCNIVASTNTSDLNLLAEQGLFHSGLAALLQENKYTIPPLRKRKGDLLLLVDFFIIKECFKGTQRKIIQGISPASYRRIMEYDWPGNMEELEIVIRRAVNLAKHDHLMPEDIFLGMAPPKGKYTFNLLQIPLLLSFFTHPYYPTAFQILTGIFFSSIILAGFLGNPSPEQNISVYLVWALWWPLLTISWFFGARIWCSLCPMGALNDLSSRFFTLGKKAPTFIRDKGVYLSAGGLLLITLGETAS